MKKLFASLIVLASVFAYVPTAKAINKNITVTPSVVGGNLNNVISSEGEYAPGFSTGSIVANATVANAKTDLSFDSLLLFERSDVRLDEIKSISYWTKKGTTHLINPSDWYLTIYTERYSDQVGGWYGARIGAEPYFSDSLVETPDEWNKWSTLEGDNQLRFFESTYGYFGSYVDPDYSDFITGGSLLGSGRPTSHEYASLEILKISIQTGSGWANGFTGKLDGLKIELQDGSITEVNFEADDTQGPAAPVIVAPYENQYFKTAPILNDWSNVTDPSGILKYRIEYIYDDHHTFSGAPYRETVISQRNHSPAISEQGGVTIRVQAFDGLGNEGSWSEPRHYFYDATSPSNPGIPTTTPNPTSSHTQMWTWTASSDPNGSNGSGVKSYQYRVDGGSWADIGNVLSINTNLTAGTHSFDLKAIDYALNESSASSGMVEVFTVPVSKEECLSGNWENLFKTDKSSFKNQGECVSYVNHNDGKGNDAKEGNMVQQYKNEAIALLRATLAKMGRSR